MNFGCGCDVGGRKVAQPTCPAPRAMAHPLLHCSLPPVLRFCLPQLVVTLANTADVHVNNANLALPEHMLRFCRIVQMDHHHTDRTVKKHEFMLCTIVNSHVQHCTRTGNNAARGFAFKASPFRLIRAFLFFTIPCPRALPPLFLAPTGPCGGQKRVEAGQLS